MSTSADGGLTWGARARTANAASGLGGQPRGAAERDRRGPDQQRQRDRDPRLPLHQRRRELGQHDRGSPHRRPTPSPAACAPPLPSAEIDARRQGLRGVAGLPLPQRLRGQRHRHEHVDRRAQLVAGGSHPDRRRRSAVDHFIPGLAVDRSTSGDERPPRRSRTTTTRTRSCTDGDVPARRRASSRRRTAARPGRSPVQLAGPMSLTWLATTSQGYMVGDYISTSFSSGRARPLFASANPPSGGVFAEAMFTSPTSTGPSASPGDPPDPSARRSSSS